MDLRRIRDLIKLMQGTDVEEIEVSEGNDRVRIRRGVHDATHVGASASPRPPSTSAPSAPETRARTSPAPAPQRGHVVTSPFVGTFYRASSPDTAPFVEEGSTVRKGQVLCVVEAMKLMNEIESDVSGVVAEIFPLNGQPVEFGQPLFVIEPLAA